MPDARAAGPVAKEIALLSASILPLYHDCDVHGNTPVLGEGETITAVTKSEESSLGGRLRAARLAAGLSQADLATRAGLKSQGAVSNIEAGERDNPAAGTLLQLAKVLGVRPYWLLYGKGPMKEGGAAMPTPGSAFRARYSQVGLDLLDLFERIEDEDKKEALYADFQSKINAALQGLPSQLSEYASYERDATPKTGPPPASRKQPGKRQAAPSEDSTPSPAASRRRAR